MQRPPRAARGALGPPRSEVIVGGEGDSKLVWYGHQLGPLSGLVSLTSRADVDLANVVPAAEDTKPGLVALP